MKHPFYKLSNYFKFAFISILMLFVLQQANAQYPSIPGNPVTLENSNIPDPFFGNFKNAAGNVVYSIYAPDPSSSNLSPKIYCIDKSIPVCDGTKDALSLSSTPNTNAKLAYAIWLANELRLSDNDGRNLIWATLGQANTCAGVCATLLTEVNKYSTSAVFSISMSHSAPPASPTAGDKIIYTITSNLSRILLPDVTFNNSLYLDGYRFCDASGNDITPSNLSIETINTVAHIVNADAPSSTTFYMYRRLYGGGFNGTRMCLYNFSFSASDATIWSRTTAPACQPLAFMMLKPAATCDYIDFLQCKNVAVTSINTSPPNPQNPNPFTLSVTATGEIPDWTQYSWSGKLNGTNVFTSTQASPSFTPTERGTYSFTVTLTNPGFKSPDGCVSTASTTVFVDGPCQQITNLQVSANPTSINTGGNITLNASGNGLRTDLPTEMTWTLSNGQFYSTGSNPSINLTMSQAGVYTFTVNATNPGIGVCSESATGTFTVVTAPCTPIGVITATATPSSIILGSNSSLSVTGTGVSGSTMYAWSGPSSFTSTSNGPTVSPSTVGNFI